MTINKKIKGFLIHSMALAMHMNIQYSKVFGSSYEYDLEDVTTWVYYKNMLGELHDIQKTEKEGYFKPPTIRLETGELVPLTKDVLNNNPRLKADYMEFDTMYDSIANTSNLHLYCKAVAYDIRPEDLEKTELTILGYPEDIFSDGSSDMIVGLQEDIYKFGYKWLNTEIIPYDDMYIHFFFASLYSYIHKHILANKTVKTDGMDATKYMKEVKINSFKYLGKHIYPLSDASINWLANNIELLYQHLATDKVIYLVDDKVFRPSGYYIKTLYSMDDSYTIYNDKPIYSNKKHILADEYGNNLEVITAEEIIHSTKNEIPPSMENLLQNNAELDASRIPIIDARTGQRLKSRYLMVDRLEYEFNKDMNFVLEYLIYTTNKKRNDYINLDFTSVDSGYRDISYKSILANILAIYTKYGITSSTIYTNYIIDEYTEEELLNGIPEPYHDIIRDAFSKIQITFDLKNPFPYISIFNLVENKTYISDSMSLLYINKAIQNVRVKSLNIPDVDELIEYGNNNPILDISIKSLGVLLSVIWDMHNATNEDTEALKQLLEKVVSYATIVVSKPTVSNIKVSSPSHNIVSNLDLVNLTGMSKCLGYQTVVNKVYALDYSPHPTIIEYEEANIVTDSKLNVYTGKIITIDEQPKIVAVS